MQSRSSATPVAIMVVTICAFIVSGVWWLEDRFDSTTAAIAIGGLFGVVCVIIGYLLSLANTKTTLNAAGDFNHDLASVERYRQQAFRDMTKANSQIQILDARRVDQIAQQRANLLVDLERERMKPQQTDIWSMDELADIDYEEVG